jgi:hypothetical protein
MIFVTGNTTRNVGTTRRRNRDDDRERPGRSGAEFSAKNTSMDTHAHRRWSLRRLFAPAT